MSCRRGFILTVLVLATLLADIANAQGLAIKLSRFSGTNCDAGSQIGKTKVLHNNHCWNWPKDRGFESFSYTRAENDPNKTRYLYMYDLPDCNVAVYSEADCRGQRYFMGPFPPTEDHCGRDFDFFARSVGVACDRPHDYQGRRCETWCPGVSHFDFQGQVNAVGVKHNETELRCCEEQQPCEYAKIDGKWKALGCQKPQSHPLGAEKRDELIGKPGANTRLQAMGIHRKAEAKAKVEQELAAGRSQQRAQAQSEALGASGDRFL